MVNVNYCVEDELKLCFNHLQCSRFLAYINLTWQQYNYKLRCGMESTTLFFSESEC